MPRADPRPRGLSPVEVFAVLHVEQHGRDELVHVLRLPDDGLKLIVHRLPDHALQPFDPSNTDPGANEERGERKSCRNDSGDKTGADSEGAGLMR